MSNKARVRQHGSRMNSLGRRRKHQHYVPLHYLRQFSTDKKRINSYNIPGNFYALAPIKGQCKEKYFYGEDERWEEWLGTVEDRCAEALRRLTATDTVPPHYSEDCTCARMWTAVQKVRTALHAEQMAAMLHTADKVFYPTESARRWANEGDMRLDATRSQAIQQSLGLAKVVFQAIQDLRLTILQSDGNEFWTSDNPIQEYNIFTERDNVRSGLGAGSQGLLLFVPLCPRRCMLLHDGIVYEVANKGRRNGVMRATATDVEFVNRLQVITCKKHVYFQSDEEASRIETELRRARRRRTSGGSIVREAVNPEDATDTLIHMAKRMHNLAMTLSFIQVRKSAERVPLSERGQYDRNKTRHAEQEAPHCLVDGGQSFIETRTHYATKTQL